MTLLEFIRLPHKWQWSYCDCTMFAADWVLEKTGCDPAFDLRGTYASGVEANCIVNRAGGIDQLVGERLEQFGFHQVAVPRDGDVGIVSVLAGFDEETATVKEIPGLCFGPLWAVMSARGAMVKKVPHSKVWRIA